MPVVVGALCFVVYFLGYRFYARYLARRVFRLDDAATTIGFFAFYEIDGRAAGLALLLTTLIAMVEKLVDFGRAGTWPLLVIGVVLVLLTLALIAEPVRRLRVEWAPATRD